MKSTGPKNRTKVPVDKPKAPVNKTKVPKNKTKVPVDKPKVLVNKTKVPKNKTKTIQKKDAIPEKQTTQPNNKNKENVQKVTDFVTSKLGCGYAYGSEGQTLSNDLLDRLKKKFPKDVKDSTSQWLGKECYDCSGLTMKALQEAGISVHHSAHWTWTEDMKQRGDINDIPKDKLCLVFRKGSSGEMVHIGVYLGNGKVIEAKGADYGVVETDLAGSSWTNWGVPEGLE